MMRALTRVLVFFMFFSMEVRVKASQNYQLFQSPHKVFRLKTASLSISAQKGLVLEKLDPKYFKYIEGNIWFQTANELVVKTVYGEVRSGGGEFWLLRDDKGVRIRNVNSRIELKFRDGKEMELPEGFEVWLGGVNEKGQSTFGMIEPLRMQEHIVLWGSLFQGSSSDFKAQVQNLKNSQKDVQVYSAHVYESVAKRHIASIEEQAAMAQKRKEDQQKKRQEYKKFMLDRVFGR